MSKSSQSKSGQSDKITPRSKDYAQWYQDVIRQGDLAEPAEVVKGCMVIKPHGYAVWEKIQGDLDRRFKETGHKNAYFPLFIPESFLKKEAEHVEGFSPELAVVTIGGGKQLEEPYVVRPTSETIIGHFFAKWIESWRDLPLLINQWANVVRWELRTRMFLRTTEFLWQEGHTAHASQEEAEEETLRMLDVYAEFAEDMMAMPVIKGRKTQAEKFAGAVHSYAIEAMMQNGLALQAGTSHDLGQNFGKAFNVRFQNRDKRAGVRLADQLGRQHAARRRPGDEPFGRPRPGAAAQAGPDPGGDRADLPQGRGARRRGAEGPGHRARISTKRDVAVEVDDRDGYKPGNKFFQWEQRGVPVRLELGPRDLASNQVMLKRRDGDDKESVPMDGLAERIPPLLDEIQQDLLVCAQQRLAANTTSANSFGELSEILERPAERRAAASSSSPTSKTTPSATPRSRRSRPACAASRWWTSTTAPASASSPASPCPTGRW